MFHVKQGGYRKERLLIGLSRRDIHNFNLLRHRSFELSTAGRFVQPDEVEFLHSLIYPLWTVMKNGYQDAIWITASEYECLAAEVGVGAASLHRDGSGSEHDVLCGPAGGFSGSARLGYPGDDGDADPWPAVDDERD